MNESAIQHERCRTLWAAVLVEAIRVATTKNKKKRDWCGHRDFLAGGGNFIWICKVLDLEPDYVLRKVRERIENQDGEFYLLRLEG